MINHNFSEIEMENIIKWQGKLEGKRVELTCKYKKGEQGIVFMETVDEENDRPYMFVKLDKAQAVHVSKFEVFWYDEIKLVEE